MRSLSEVSISRSSIRALTALVLFAIPAPAAARTGVDWKIYGGTSVDAEVLYCFYDANGVGYTPVHHIRAWTECLQQKDLDEVSLDKEAEGMIIIKNGAEKFAHHYLPPIAGVEDLNSDQIETITIYEEIADISNITPQSSISYELNCSEGMLRELAIRPESKAVEPLDWEFASPESPLDTLLKILCTSDR